MTAVRSKPFMLYRTIRWGFPLLQMLYILALGLFIRKLKANLVLHGITLPSAITAARYSDYADDVNAFVKSRAKIYENSR